ncbi:MAG: hypothetical protein WCB85_04900, partial [Candidatus Dormiibacterota bacterium]
PIICAATAALLGLAVAACSGSSAATGSVHTPRPSGTAEGSGVARGSTPPSSTPAAGTTTGPGGCAIPPPPSPADGLTLYTCYRLSGQVTGQGGFADDGQGAGAESCSQWAAQGQEPVGTTDAVLFLPDPGDAGARLGGQAISFYLEIGPYSGPGAYSSTKVTESATWGSNESWSTNADPAAGFSAQVNADGSGTATAAALRNDSSGPSTETVTESWTCAVEPGG